MTLSHYPPLLHHDDLINSLGEFHCMRRHNNGLTFEIPPQGLAHQKFTHMNVDCTQHIV